MIRASDIAITIGGDVILEGFDLEVAGGEIVALVGPSGAGKSSILSVLFGVLDATSGVVHRDAGAAWSDLTIVPQELGLAPELTLRENVALPVELSGGDIDVVGRLLAALDLVHLADRLPEEVSLGEQQRAAIARALVLRSPIVLVDEPTSHQDERRSDLIMAALRAAAANGAAVLVSTHDDAVIAKVDHVVELPGG
jgi:putative ABC transport system ATP-binding protein